jgi:hypothetical protein
MGTSRTSNKDIFEAIEAQTHAISGLVAALSGQAAVTPAAQVITPAPEAQAPEVNGIDVDKKYMGHMDKKVAKLTASDGQPRVLYLRRNLHNEVKLAYALKVRWDDGIKDNGMIGAVKVYS